MRTSFTVSYFMNCAVFVKTEKSSAETAAPDTRARLLQTGYALVAAKGFTAVGLAEILSTAGVPKGSFYHYFPSKEVFGEALIHAYFQRYLQQTQAILQDGKDNVSARTRLRRYFQLWRDQQSADSPLLHCPVVKLTGEVADLSEPMRAALRAGCDAVIAQIAAAIAEAQQEGSISPLIAPNALACTVYYLWLGASLAEKLSPDGHALRMAMEATLTLI